MNTMKDSLSVSASVTMKQTQSTITINRVPKKCAFALGPERAQTGMILYSHTFTFT
jgi:hypothetical protein